MHVEARIWPVSRQLDQHCRRNPLTGEAVVLDALGSTVFTTTISGDLDLAGNTMTVEWEDLFFGYPVTTTVLGLLGEGIYTRPDGGAGEITAQASPFRRQFKSRDSGRQFLSSISRARRS
jgi:hypothetical protein